MNKAFRSNFSCYKKSSNIEENFVKKSERYIVGVHKGLNSLNTFLGLRGTFKETFVGLFDNIYVNNKA